MHQLFIEINKVAHDMSPDIMEFSNYEILHIIIYGIHRIFVQTPIHRVYNGTESVPYLGPKICQQIPAEIKDKDSLDGFRKKIKKWKPTECLCRICRNFLNQI